ncbi:hypothetical protein [Candidatus Poriferisodalis sp.]|uniref:hypothetical protein n=1 Tax=Candidatus Poriferisodalis sp. TaxID=3101277 RepID=UPI003AF5D6B6
MSKPNTPTTPYEQLELQLPGLTCVYVDVEEIETSPYRDLVNVTIGLRFVDLINAVADRLTWPVTRAQTEKLTREEPVRRRHLKKKSDSYMIVEGPTPDGDDPQLHFMLSSREVVDRLRMLVGAGVASQTPQQELIALVSGGLNPFANTCAMIALRHREAA